MIYYFTVWNTLFQGTALAWFRSYLSDRTQTVSTAAWITLKAPRVEHTSPLLCSLHWLPVQQRIKQFVMLHWPAQVRSTCQNCLCVHSIQMPALIVRQFHSYNSPCKNQDLWAAFLCLSRTRYMKWPTIWFKTQRFTVHFQRCFENSSFSPGDLNCNYCLCTINVWLLL